MGRERLVLLDVPGDTVTESVSSKCTDDAEIVQSVLILFLVPSSIRLRRGFRRRLLPAVSAESASEWPYQFSVLFCPGKRAGHYRIDKRRRRAIPMHYDIMVNHFRRDV